jgi:hypothetical protein
VKNNQGGVGGFSKGAGKNDFAPIMRFAGQAQVFGAKRRTASNKIVYYLVEQGKVWHRTNGEFFQKAGQFVNAGD